MADERAPKYVRGDPDNHEIVNAIAKLYWPGRLGCVMWLLTTTVVETGGLYVFGKIDPEFLHKPESILPVALLTIGAMASGPVMSLLPVVHFDTSHYDHTTDHVHLLPVIAKGIINTAIFLEDKAKNLVSKKDN